MGVSKDTVADRPQRILVVLPSWVGDFVMATPTLRALRTRFASSSITFCGRRVLDDLIAGSAWKDALVHWEPKRRALYIELASPKRIGTTRDSVAS